MEDFRCRRRPPLAVLREFCGSRLEPQVLARAYELAVPTLRLTVGTVHQSSGREHVVRQQNRYQTIAEGA